MPIRVGTRGTWRVIHPTTDWQVMPAFMPTNTLEVATELYYVNVIKQ
jgi:hypothetical protein